MIKLMLHYAGKITFHPLVVLNEVLVLIFHMYTCRTCHALVYAGQREATLLHCLLLRILVVFEDVWIDVDMAEVLILWHVIAQNIKVDDDKTNVETYLRTGEEIAWSRQLVSVPVPKRGLREMLAFCRANGIRTAVASSSPRHVVEHNLTAAAIRDSFDAITTGDEVEHSKPAPDIFLLAASRIGIEPESCCVFEDAFSGICGAVAAGMGAVLIPDQVAPTDEIRAICRVCPDLLAAIKTVSEQ